MRRTQSQGAALASVAKTTEAMRTETTGHWGSCADVRRGPSPGAVLAVATKAHDIIEVYRVPKRGDNPENGSDDYDYNSDDGSEGALRGKLTGESKTAGRVVD